MLNTSVEADTLDYYLQKRNLKISDDSKVLVVNALAGDYLKKLNPENTTCLQTFYPIAEHLKNMGFRTIKEIDQPEATFDFVIYFGTKFKDRNLFTYAQSIDLLKPEGSFCLILQNKGGAKSNKKYLESFYGNMTSLSKNRCRLMITQKTEAYDKALYEEWISKGDIRKVEKTELISYSGVFASESC